MASIFLMCEIGSCAYTAGSVYRIDNKGITCDNNGDFNGFIRKEEMSNHRDIFKNRDIDLLNGDFAAQFKMLELYEDKKEKKKVICTCGKEIELTHDEFIDIIYSDGKGCRHKMN